VQRQRRAKTPPQLAADRTSCQVEDAAAYGRVVIGRSLRLEIAQLHLLECDGTLACIHGEPGVPHAPASLTSLSISSRPTVAAPIYARANASSHFCQQPWRDHTHGTRHRWPPRAVIFARSAFVLSNAHSRAASRTSLDMAEFPSPLLRVTDERLRWLDAKHPMHLRQPNASLSHPALARTDHIDPPRPTPLLPNRDRRPLWATAGKKVNIAVSALAAAGPRLTGSRSSEVGAWRPGRHHGQWAQDDRGNSALVASASTMPPPRFDPLDKHSNSLWE